MLKYIIFVVFLCLISGCQTASQGDVMLLHNRIKSLEERKEGGNEFVVWVENSNGSYIPVRIKQIERSYKGPKGEYYNSMPTSEQLKKAYGF